MAVPSAPSSLTLTKDISDGTFDVTATWASSVGATSGYTLDRSYNGAAFVELSSGMSGLTFEDLDLSAQGRYVYRIAAENVDGLSDYSLAAINISYADIGAIQSGGADIGAVQGSAPVTGAVNLVGGTSGMAPFPVHWYADIEGVGSTWATGSGEWSEGRAQLRVIDDGTGEVYSPSLSRNAMTLTCPISGKQESCFDRISGMPYGAAVIWDAGSYKCQIRYQNRDGDWSAWADSSTITVSADTRTTYYVDGTSGNDSNDGTSWAQAKATLDAALGLIAGDDIKVVCKDDTVIDCAAYTNLATNSNIYIVRSYDGTSKPQITLSQGAGSRAVDIWINTVIEGLQPMPDGVNDSIFVGAAFATAYNNALVDVDFGAIGSLVITGDTNLLRDGLLIYGGEQLSQITSYCFYGGWGSRAAVLGVDWQLGSSTESVIRAGGSGHGGKWLAVDYSNLDYDHSAAKDVLRLYVERFVSVYRTSCKNGVVQTYAESGHTTFDDYRFDCMRYSYIFAAGTGKVNYAFFREGADNLVMASCLLYRDADSLGNPFVLFALSSYVTDTSTNFRLLNVTAFTAAEAGIPCVGLALNSSALADWHFRGIVFMSDDATILNSADRLMELPSSPAAGSELVESVLFVGSNGGTIIQDGATNPTTIVGVNALSYASGNVGAALTVDSANGDLSGGTAHQGIVTDITGVFESLTAGAGYTTEINRTAGAWDAGAVQRDSLLIEDPTYIDPISLSGTINGNDVDLEWNLVTQTIDGYEVQRRTDGGSWETITVT